MATVSTVLEAVVRIRVDRKIKSHCDSTRPLAISLMDPSIPVDSLANSTLNEFLCPVMNWEFGVTITSKTLPRRFLSL